MLILTLHNRAGSCSEQGYPQKYWAHYDLREQQSRLIVPHYVYI